MILVQINGVEKVFATEVNLEWVIDSLSLQNKKIAVEINEQIIPRSEYTKTLIKSGDIIEIVAAVGGG
ncbi:MAG: sulfur carrier protein ThiS [Burkholderiales bacterium]